MKIIYMGTPDFAVKPLEEINKYYEVVLVVTQEDKGIGRGRKVKPTPVKQKAEELGIEVFQPKNVSSEDSVKKLKTYEADLLVVAAYGQILRPSVLNIPKLFPINIHASILPKYRGAAPINWAILKGEKETGVSIMKMEEGLDTGPVAYTLTTEMENKNAEELTEELSTLGANAILDFIKSVENDSFKFTPQDDDLASYAPKINKEMGEIDFNWNTKKIVNTVRALYPSPATFMKYKDTLLKIYKVEPLFNEENITPGTVLSTEKELMIKTKDGAISVLEIQAPGKKRLDIKSFLLGYQIEEGSIIG